MCGKSFVVIKLVVEHQAGTDGQTDVSPSIGPVGVKKRMKGSEQWKYVSWMENPCDLVLLSMAGTFMISFSDQTS